MEGGRNMIVFECAHIQGYLFKSYTWHPDGRHNYFMLGNTMSICVFQLLLVAALRCIGFHAPDPWLTGKAEAALREEALKDVHPSPKWEQLKAASDHFKTNPPGDPVLPPTAGATG